VAALLLADDLFLCSCDDSTGRSRLSERATGLGLASAVIGELLLLDKVGIQHGEITVLDDHPPSDPLAHSVLDQLHRERDVRAVRAWLRYLSRDVHELVGQRLVRSGHVRPVRARWRIRARVVYQPVDVNAAAWPAARLATRLIGRQPLDDHDLLLAGLALAIGLEPHILIDTSVKTRQHLRHLLGDVPPSFRALMAETEAAVGDAVLSARG